MNTLDATYRQIEHDIWAWINEFVTVPNAFYDHRFAPCPFARQAVLAKTVDVQVWQAGDVFEFIRDMALAMGDSAKLTTRVLVFPPQIRLRWGITEFVEQLNAELICRNIFLNTGAAKTTHSKYPGSSSSDPYFFVIANSLAAVLSGAEALAGSDYYKNWPAEHFALVVERRARMAKQFGGAKL
jgi:hypothetical protein